MIAAKWFLTQARMRVGWTPRACDHSCPSTLAVAESSALGSEDPFESLGDSHSFQAIHFLSPVIRA